MISNLDPSSELFLNNVERIQERLAEANNQVSSGKKIATAADAPDQIGSLLQLRAERQHNTQIQANLVLAKSDADSADNALAFAIKLMDSAVTIAGQGANFTQSASDRQTLAQQVQALQQEMVSYSRTQVQGRYIFGGDLSNMAPYQFNQYSANGVDQLTGTAATAQVEDPAGGSFLAAKTAQQIFDARNPDGTYASNNVFAALNNLRIALLNNNPTAVSNLMPSLQAASAQLNTMEAFYGSVQSRIQDATDFASSYDVRLQTAISQTEDADVTSAALDATTANTHLQAAFQMRAKMPHTSLFDFLA